MEFKRPQIEAAAGWISRFTIKDAFIGAGIVLTGVLLFAMRHYIFLVAMIVINLFSSRKLRVLRRSQIGIEMVMFTTVMSGVVYGPVIGAVMGAASMMVDYAFATRFSYFSIVTIPSYAAVGALSHYLSGFMGITMLGIAMTVAYVIFSNSIICGLMGGHISKSLRFAITDIAFNIFVFTAIAPFVIRLVA